MTHHPYEGEEYQEPRTLRKASQNNFGVRFSSESKYEDAVPSVPEEDYDDYNYNDNNQPPTPSKPPKKSKFSFMRDRRKDKDNKENKQRNNNNVPKLPPLKMVYAIAIFLFSVGVIGAVWNISVLWHTMNWGGRIYGLAGIGTQILFTSLFIFLYRSTPSEKDLKMATTKQMEELFDDGNIKKDYSCRLTTVSENRRGY